MWQVLFSPCESVCQFHQGTRRHLSYSGSAFYVGAGRFCQGNDDMIEKKAAASSHSTSGTLTCKMHKAAPKVYFLHLMDCWLVGWMIFFLYIKLKRNECNYRSNQSANKLLKGLNHSAYFTNTLIIVALPLSLR